MSGIRFSKGSLYDYENFGTGGINSNPTNDTMQPNPDGPTQGKSGFLKVITGAGKFFNTFIQDRNKKGAAVSSASLEQDNTGKYLMIGGGVLIAVIIILLVIKTKK
jgi:hypothetical protein